MAKNKRGKDGQSFLSSQKKSDHVVQERQTARAAYEGKTARLRALRLAKDAENETVNAE